MFGKVRRHCHIECNCPTFWTKTLSLAILANIMPTHIDITSPLEQQLLTQYGERLKRSRQSRKMSAVNLASRVCISRTTLHAIESGNPSVTIGSYLRVMSELGMVADLALLGTSAVDVRATSAKSRLGSHQLVGRGRHQLQDLQSLLMHREAVRLIHEDPSLVQRAGVTLARWCAVGNPHSKPLWEQWRQILALEDWDTALSESERGNQLRQASPLATVLPNETRLGIIAKVKALKAATDSGGAATVYPMEPEGQSHAST
jgi:transcriptional regulator with XRE-family HTH domain